jgi:hypothetical protein
MSGTEDITPGTTAQTPTTTEATRLGLDTPPHPQEGDTVLGPFPTATLAARVKTTVVGGSPTGRTLPSEAPVILEAGGLPRTGVSPITTDVADSLAESLLPPGSSIDEYQQTCVAIIYDSLNAFTKSQVKVTVNPFDISTEATEGTSRYLQTSRSNNSEYISAVSRILSKGYDRAMNATDPDALYQFLSIASSTLNTDRDCSMAPNCSALHRDI